MAEYNPAGVTVMPYLVKEEAILGMETLPKSNLKSTEYEKLFDIKDVQEGIQALIKNNDFAISKFELLVLEPGDDLRQWQISCDPNTDRKVTVFIALDDLEENSGAPLWIPHIHKLEECPNNEQLSKSYFEDNNQKIYPMKKRFACMKKGDVTIVHPYMWFSLGYNTSRETKRFCVATYSIVE